MSKAFEPNIVAFTCNWCSYGGADLAGISRIQYPTNAKVIRLMCSGRVDPSMVLQAFKNGADGVMISGCHIGDCHYSTGNYRTQVRYDALSTAMEMMGLHPDRLKLLWASASEGQQWADGITEMTESIKKLGPSPLNGREKPKKKAEPKKKSAPKKKAAPKKAAKKASKKTAKKAPKKAAKKGGAKK
jgi:F420-non-reducing hydrogenase iron-sulfur subunit